MTVGLSLLWDEDRLWDEAFDWLGTSYDAGLDRVNVVVVEVAAPDGTRWFSDGRWSDKYETLHADPRIGNEVRIQRRAALVFWGSGRAVYGVGSIELINDDGGLDAWALSRLRRSVLRVYFGPDGVPLPAMVKVARALVDSIETVGESLVRVITRDAGFELDIPVQTLTFTTAFQLGRLRPVLFGRCASVPAMQTSVDLHFTIHDSTAASSAGGFSYISEVSDRGVALTSGTQWNTSIGGENIGFQLLQSTAGRITCFAAGPSREFGVFQPSRVNWFIDALLSLRLGWPQSRIDLAALAALSVETNAVLGRYVDSAVTYGQICTEVGDSFSGWWWIDFDGVFRLERWRSPAGTPVLELDSTAWEGDLTVRFDKAPGLADAVLATRNWHVFSPGELADSVRDTAAGAALTRPYRTSNTFTVADEYADARGAAGADRLDSATAGAGVSRPEVESGMPTLLASGANEAAHRQTLYGVPRYFYECRALVDALDAIQLYPGDVARITHDRFGLDAGLLVRIVSVEFNLGDTAVDLVTWGGAPELEDDKESKE